MDTKVAKVKLFLGEIDATKKGLFLKLVILSSAMLLGKQILFHFHNT